MVRNKKLTFSFLMVMIALALCAFIPLFFPLLSVDNSLTSERKMMLNFLHLAFGDDFTNLVNLDTLYISGNGFIFCTLIAGLAMIMMTIIFAFYYAFSKKKSPYSFILLGLATPFDALYIVGLFLLRSLFLASNPNYAINQWRVSLLPSYYIALIAAMSVAIYLIFIIIYMGVVVPSRKVIDEQK